MSGHRHGPCSRLRLPFLSVVILSLLAASCTSSPPPVSGSTLYRRHCAACHGVDGRGGGPLAESLRRAPTDLTTIARRQGRFDARRLAEIIDGRELVAEHGPREMPVWGAIFDEELKDKPYARYTQVLHARDLVEFLRSIQAP